jgi:hypothetical protein
MATVHILSQYIWPDAAPTAVYAEQLAVRLQESGWQVSLVGGRGHYRAVQRDKPPVPMVYLRHWQGKRGKLGQTLAEYAAVNSAFACYIDQAIQPGDLAIVTSAPPNTVRLACRIRSRGAKAIYWLQDYYPELIRGIAEYPILLRQAFSRFWNYWLGRWNVVVKIGANLNGPSHNSVVIRNWPTLKFETPERFETGTALYAGNLGYGHDIRLFVAACEELRKANYKITLRADGPGTKQLPEWLRVQPLYESADSLKADLLRHEVHLVAAHPRIRRAIFPSKIWNSIACGRRLICTGFAGEMEQELEAARIAPFEDHLSQWEQLIRRHTQYADAELSPMSSALA